MNYRHAFHAGNFADLAKHAAVALVLDRLLTEAGALCIVDTHAGAGLYDLSGSMARKSGEAEAGIVRLMADQTAPSAFQGVRAAVKRLNPTGAVTLYPGSPRQIAERLRRGDTYVGAELHEEDFALLQQALAPFKPGAVGIKADGYEVAQTAAGQGGRLFVLVDPPFERADDYERTARLAGVLLRRNSQAVVAIWTPLKDLETFDSFVRGLEDAVAAPILVAELRLKSLDNPLRLNGCAMVFINAPKGLSAEFQPALDWLVGHIGDRGAQARIWRAGG
ncbi:MAG TPA: 23S rRNA (adenine(2030)-N(6))-methyltransferase RlmJ [Caulobacteraceae bacterium]|nr:23S rRNA (adenine(2030)-N(6))-methyltransferase RlmJ [Caulobacteraceae bacterium]